MAPRMAKPPDVPLSVAPREPKPAVSSFQSSAMEALQPDSADKSTLARRSHRRRPSRRTVTASGASHRPFLRLSLHPRRSGAPGKTRTTAVPAYNRAGFRRAATKPKRPGFDRSPRPARAKSAATRQARTPATRVCRPDGRAARALPKRQRPSVRSPAPGPRKSLTLLREPKCPYPVT